MNNYLKENKWKILLSTLATLVPVLVGLIIWEKLPEELPIHWGPTGEVDGWASRGFAVFGMPAILAALNLLCHIVTGHDRKNKDQNKKVFTLIFWIIPTLANVACMMTYLTAMGISAKAPNIIIAVVGVGLAIVGNYLPKCKLNYTIGIKIVWTLESEANWLATHRFAGKVWLCGGILLAFLSFLPAASLVWAVIPVLLCMVAAPLIYSYVFFRHHSGEEGYFRVGVIDKDEDSES